MARIRYLKPEFFDDYELCQLKPLARLLFAGLWCWADREGRLLDEPARLKKNVLGYDTCNVNALLNDLARAGLIVRYEVEGRRYIAIKNFLKHQKPHTRELPSTYPQPPLGDAQARPEHNLGDDRSAQEQIREQIRGQEQEREPDLALSAAGDFRRCATAYDSMMGNLAMTPTTSEQIRRWLSEGSTGRADDTEPFPTAYRGQIADWFVIACEQAALQNKRSLGYVFGILARCKSEGRPPGSRKHTTGVASIDEELSAVKSARRA